MSWLPLLPILASVGLGLALCICTRRVPWESIVTFVLSAFFLVLWFWSVRTEGHTPAVIIGAPMKIEEVLPQATPE